MNKQSGVIFQQLNFTQIIFHQQKLGYITYGDTGVQNYGDKRVQNCGDSRFILDLRIVVTKFRVQNYGDKQFAVTISIYWCVTTIPQHNNQLQNCGDNMSAISFIEKNGVFLSISKGCKISDFQSFIKPFFPSFWGICCILTLVFLSLFLVYIENFRNIRACTHCSNGHVRMVKTLRDSFQQRAFGPIILLSQ